MTHVRRLASADWSSGTIKDLRAYQKRKKCSCEFFVLYTVVSLCPWLVVGGDVDPETFSGRVSFWRPNGRVLTDLSLSIRQDPILYVVLRYGHCETSNNTAYWNWADLDGASDES